MLGVGLSEDDAGAIVEPHIGGSDGGDGLFADNVSILRCGERRQGFGHVDVLPVAGHRLTAAVADELQQVVLAGNLQGHLFLAAAQQVVLGPRLEGRTDELQHGEGVDGGQELLKQPQLVGPRYQAVAVIVVGIDFIHEAGRAHIVRTGHLVAHRTEQRLLGTVDFRLREAVAVYLLLGGNEVGNALAQLALRQLHRGIGGTRGPQEARILDGALGVGRVVERQGVEAQLHEAVQQTALQVLTVVVGRLHGTGLRQQHEHVKLRLLHVGVGGYARHLGRVLRDGRCLMSLIGPKSPVCPKLLPNQPLYKVGINVAHHGHGHQLRTVPMLIVVANGLRRGVPDDGRVADGDTARIKRAVQQLHHQLHRVVCLGAAT